jgi:protease I
MTSAPLRIAVLIDDGFDDDEFSEILEQFEVAGTRVTVVAPFPGRLYSGRRGRVETDCDLDARSARAQMFSALVIPGGYAADRLRLRHVILDLVRAAIAQNIPIGAVGHAPQVLISAGALSGRTITCWPSIAVDVKNAGGLYVDRPVVEDHGIVTARKIDDIGPFVEAVLHAVSSQTQ